MPASGFSSRMGFKTALTVIAPAPVSLNLRRDGRGAPRQPARLPPPFGGVHLTVPKTILTSPVVINAGWPYRRLASIRHEDVNDGEIKARKSQHVWRVPCPAQ